MSSAELCTPARLKRDQHFIDVARLVQRGALFVELVDHNLSVDMVEVDQKFVRMLGLDTEGLKRLFGKVFELLVTMTSQGVLTATANTCRSF